MSETTDKDLEKIASNDFAFKMFTVKKLWELDVKYEKRTSKLEVKAGVWGVIGGSLVFIVAYFKTLL